MSLATRAVFKAIVLTIISNGVIAVAAVTSSGDTSIGSGKNAFTFVGRTGTGTLRIDAGSGLTSGQNFIGYNAGSNGTATVSGTLSAWGPGLQDTAREMNVGWFGNGVLNIDSGGSAGGFDDTYIGYHIGSSGAISVLGAGSRFGGTRLYVGGGGSGTLTVANGGQVSSTTLFASLSDLFGNGSISAAGGVLDTDIVFDSTHPAGARSVAFGSGGTISLTINSSSWLGVGYKGTGTLEVADATTLQNFNGFLGYQAGSIGVATISGAGSSWTLSNLLQVGSMGDGNLTIEDGARVGVGTIYLGGYLIGSQGGTGVVNVRGSGSALSAAVLDIGRSGGVGTLTISDGGSIRTGRLYGALKDFQGDGTVTATVGGILDADVVFDSTHGKTQTFSFGSGGTIQMTFGAGAEIGAGYTGSGTLTIAGGQQITGTNGYLGYWNGSSGTAAVRGAGSAWTSKDCYIGYGGSGTLIIEDGGQVLDSTGTISADFMPESSGSVIVQGAGSKWTNSGGMVINNKGALTITDAGQVTAASVAMGSRGNVRFHVSGDSMLVLGSATTTGRLTGSDASCVVGFYADALLPAGTYRPITEYAGRSMTLSGITYNTVGGTWDSAAQTFTVAPATSIAAGSTNTVSSGERLLITDSATSERVGASFGSISGPVSFSASLSTNAEQRDLMALLGPCKRVYGTWDFTTDFNSSSDVLLSFDIGHGAGDLAVWHLEDGMWSPYTPSLFTYDSDGLASFNVNSFSGYAITDAVPEPDAATMIITASAMVLLRSRLVRPHKNRLKQYKQSAKTIWETPSP